VLEDHSPGNGTIREARSSGNGGRDFSLSAVEMLDQQTNRIGIAMEEFYADKEALGIFALLDPYDLSVHTEKLIGFFEVDEHPPEAADGKSLLADDPDSRKGNIAGGAANQAIRRKVFILYEDIVLLNKPLLLPSLHLNTPSRFSATYPRKSII
jgi:hypothetical protein